MNLGEGIFTMLLTELKQVEELRQKLVEDRIKPSTVFDTMKQLTNNFKSWKTPYWKQKRKEFIGEVCIECGATSSDGSTMVVQHGWKPKFTTTYLTDLMLIRLQSDDEYKHIRELCLAMAKEHYPEEAPLSDVCPNCGYVSLSYRKSIGDYRCSRCKTIHPEPARAVSPKDKERYADNNAVQRRIQYYYTQNLRETAFQLVQEDEKIQKQVYLDWLDQNLSYLRFEGAKTTCKRCAYLEDKVDGEIIFCPFCERNRISASNSICRSCSYDKESGIYILTQQNALKWYKPDNQNAEQCAENLNLETDFMQFFACLLKKHKLNVIDIGDSYIKLTAEQKSVYEAISGRKSWY